MKPDFRQQCPDCHPIAQHPYCTSRLLRNIRVLPDKFKVIREFITRGGDIRQLIMCRVYPNGSYLEASYELDEKGILAINNPETDKLYTINLYLNLERFNLIQSGKIKEYIGTIEKY